jgi:serine/threonine-protein kinase RsbW
MPQAAAMRGPITAEDARVLELTSAVSSVPAARHAVAEDLRLSGIPQSVLDSVLVVVTELVSNAVLHATPIKFADSGEGVLLRWNVTNRHVLIDVTDGGGVERPELKHAPSAESEGRGLAMVNALARDWSVRSENSQVTVQAVVGPWERGVDE